MALDLLFGLSRTVTSLAIRLQASCLWHLSQARWMHPQPFYPQPISMKICMMAEQSEQAHRSGSCCRLRASHSCACSRKASSAVAVHSHAAAQAMSSLQPLEG